MPVALGIYGDLFCVFGGLFEDVLDIVVYLEAVK